MVEMEKVVASEAVGGVHAELEREEEYMYFLLLLLGVYSRDCHF
jgi:hypothetical protein